MIAALLLLACGRPGTDSASPAGEAPVAEAGADRVAYVGEAIVLDGSASTGAVSYTWSSGGGGDSGPAAEPTLSVTYSAPGHYTAFLEVADALGRTDSDSLRVTVVYPPLDTPPRVSAALVADAGAERLFAALPDFDRVAVIDRASASVSGHIETCTGPRSLSLEGGLLAVACPGDDAVELFDVGEAITRRGRIELDWGSRPFGVVVGPSAVYVTAEGSGQVLALDPEALAPSGVLAELEGDPRGLALVGRRLIVTRHRSPDAGGQWWILDLDGGLDAYTLPLDPGPDSDTEARGLPNYLQRVAVRPDGRAVALPGLKDNIERGEVRDGLPLTDETTVRADLRHLSLEPAEGPVGEALEEPQFDNRDLAAAAAYSPLGDVLYVASLGAGMVDALDSYTMLRIGGFQDLGTGLEALWASPDGGELWALAAVDRQLVAVDVSDLSAPPTELARIDLRGDLEEVLSPERLLGARIFHRSIDPRMSRDGYISCASCHLDGDSDGRTWDFTDRGEGLRNTIALQGRGGAAQGPIHWSGNFDEVQDFESDIRGAFGGQGFLSEEDWAEAGETLGPPKAGRSEELDALAAYVSGLDDSPRSPWREADGSLSEAALRGEQLFLSAETGCADCHPPPDYTDSRWEDGQPVLHDVGTLSETSGSRLGGPLTGIDTPTLRGLHASAPYLHDGSAPDLEAVLEANTEDRHGHTSGLSEAEREDLLAFLLSLE